MAKKVRIVKVSEDFKEVLDEIKEYVRENRRFANPSYREITDALSEDFRKRKKEWFDIL